VRAEADPPPIAVQIESMKRKHVRDVLAIEREVYPRPWSASLFFSELTQRKTRHYIVALADDALVGYGGLMLHGEEGHVTTVAVDPRFQRRGIGARLMIDMVATARERRAATLTLEVRVANWAAQRMYAAFGFRPIGVRKNYYAETGEDALVMRIHDLQSEDVMVRLTRMRAQTQA